MQHPLSNADPQWMGEQSISWNIMLVMTVSQDLPEDLQMRLDELNDELDSPRWTVLQLDSPARLAHEVTRARQASVQVGLCPRTPTEADPSRWILMLAGHHSRLDGMGLLAALGRLLGTEPRAEAQGLADRADGPQGSLLGRLQEVLLRPGDVAPALRPVPGADGDWFAQHSVPTMVHTSTLVSAAVQAVDRFSRRHGGRPRRPSVAIGASWVGGNPLLLGDNSALVRLTDVAVHDEDTIRARLKQAAPERTTSRAPDGILGFAVRAATRLLRSRLGSTVQVSHLGRVHLPGVETLTVHPASSGPSGVAVGAVSLVRPDNSVVTTVSLRSRADRHDQAAVEELLGDVLASLPEH